MTLPASYCVDHVQLAYATTAHRSQGRTVDTAHTLVDSSASRETFYVAMTRGKQSNKAYVLVDEDNQLGDNSARGMTRTWRETLEGILLNRDGDTSAHDTLKQEVDRIGSIRQLYAEYQTIMAGELSTEYLPVLQKLNLHKESDADSPYLGPLLANLRRLENHGENVEPVLNQIIEERGFEDSEAVLAVIHHRITNRLSMFKGSIDSEESIGGLLERSPELSPQSSDTYRALKEREQAIQIRAELLLDEATANDEPWVQALGTPLIGSEGKWRTAAIRVAIYRDYYNVNGHHPVDSLSNLNKTQSKHRSIALSEFKHLESHTSTDTTKGTEVPRNHQKPSALIAV